MAYQIDESVINKFIEAFSMSEWNYFNLCVKNWFFKRLIPFLVRSFVHSLIRSFRRFRTSLIHYT